MHRMAPSARLRPAMPRQILWPARISSVPIFRSDPNPDPEFEVEDSGPLRRGAWELAAGRRKP